MHTLPAGKANRHNLRKNGGINRNLSQRNQDVPEYAQSRSGVAIMQIPDCRMPDKCPIVPKDTDRILVYEPDF
jgi:hypothetical protein